MIEWTIFYRLLGIDDDVVDPSYYDLLAVDRRSCSKEVVERAVIERKKRLRQSIPGPEFVPLVLNFEQEQLDVAAAVLLDEARRREYDAELANRMAEPSALAILAERRRLIRLGHELLVGQMNADGTLDEDKRGFLGEKLRVLGFSVGDVAVLFRGIPVPQREPRCMSAREQEKLFFVRAVSLAITEGVLDGSDEHRLIKLAEHLSIPVKAALKAIEQQLELCGARRGQVDEGRFRDEFRERVEALCQGGVVSEKQYTALLAGAIATGVPEAVAKEVLGEYEVVEGVEGKEEEDGEVKQMRWGWLVRYGVPVAAVLLFFVFLVMQSNVVSHDDMANGTSANEQVVVSDKNKAPSGELIRDGNVRGGEGVIVERGKEPLERRVLVGDFARAVRDSYSSSGAVVDVLGDVAVTLLACRERAGVFVGLDVGVANELNVAMGGYGRLDVLSSDADVVVEPRLVGVSAGGDPERLKELADDLLSESKGRRYRAVEELRIVNSIEAAEVLLAMLRSKDVPDQAMACRILRALGDMGGEQIGLSLVDILDKPRKRVLVIPIVRTLVAMNGLGNRSKDDCAGVLIFKHTREDRLACVKWWREYYDGTAVAQFGGIKYRGGGDGDKIGRTEEMVLGLLAGAGSNCSKTGEMLSRFGWPGGHCLRSRQRGSGADKQGVNALLAGLKGVFDECLRLVRTHEDAVEYGGDVDMVELRHERHRLMCETETQRVVAELDAIGELLGVLAEQVSGNSNSDVRDDILEIGRMRRDAEDVAVDVIDEMREAAYFNLVLWDYLCRL